MRLQMRARPNRYLGIAALVVAAMFQASAARAQTPPLPAEYAAYGGLFDAAAKGLASRIDTLVEAGADPNEQDENGRTPLIVAAFRTERAAAKALLDAGANPNVLDNESYDALTIAAGANDLALVKLLLGAGANARAITGPLGGSALMTAAHRGAASIVEVLLSARAHANHANNLGATALIEAIVHGDGSERYQKTVDALIRGEADVNLPDRAGTRPLALAKAKGLTEIATLLETAGAKP